MTEQTVSANENPLEKTPIEVPKAPIGFYQPKSISVSPKAWQEIAKIRDLFSMFIASVNDVENVAIGTGESIPVFYEDYDPKTKQVTKEFLKKHNLLIEEEKTS